MQGAQSRATGRRRGRVIKNSISIKALIETLVRSLSNFGVAHLQQETGKQKTARGGKVLCGALNSVAGPHIGVRKLREWTIVRPDPGGAG